MFWIPICVIVLCGWFIKSIVDGAQTAQFQRDYNEKEGKRRSLAALVNDPELEYRLSKELDKRYAEWRRIVREFMGGSEEWEKYAWYLKGKLKAMTVLMLKEGKLPQDLTCPIGFDLSELGGNDLSGECASRMNDEFLLKVEDTLRARGIPAVVMCRRFVSVDRTEPYVPLRKLVRENGLGSSGGGSEYRFTME